MNWGNWACRSQRVGLWSDMRNLEGSSLYRILDREKRTKLELLWLCSSGGCMLRNKYKLPSTVGRSVGILSVVLILELNAVMLISLHLFVSLNFYTIILVNSSLNLLYARWVNPVAAIASNREYPDEDECTINLLWAGRVIFSFKTNSEPHLYILSLRLRGV